MFERKQVRGSVLFDSDNTVQWTMCIDPWSHEWKVGYISALAFVSKDIFSWK